MLVRVMNWVSRHILLAPFMCLFLLFGSCGSSHKSVKSDTKIIQKDSTRESVNIVHGSSTSLSELITTNGNYVIDFCIYDTRKPPNILVSFHLRTVFGCSFLLSILAEITFYMPISQ